GTGFLVSAEECLHVPLQLHRQLRQRWPLAESTQREVNQQIFTPPPRYGLPAFRVGNPLNYRKRTLQRSKTINNKLASFKLTWIRQPPQMCDHAHQRLKRFPSFFEPQFGDASTRQNFATAETVGQKLLTP